MIHDLYPTVKGSSAADGTGPGSYRRLLLQLAVLGTVFTNLVNGPPTQAQEESSATVNFARIDGEGPGWRTLTERDFERVNLKEDSITWKGNVAYCTGLPIGVERTKETFTNFEFVARWRHLRHGGNSGFFIWVAPEALEDLAENALPKSGIEIQALDHGYAENFERKNGKPSDWFTVHGDVFAVGQSKLKPFEPISPNGRRSFPNKNLSRPSPQWNHYYVRAINGEVRLWVNGEEVSGGSDAQPATGHLCLESEGSPIEFKNIRIRVLP